MLNKFQKSIKEISLFQKCFINLIYQKTTTKLLEIMEATHTVEYEGLEFEVKGEFEEAELDTGYKGGWSYWTIETGGVDVTWMLKPEIIDSINEIIVNENY